MDFNSFTPNALANESHLYFFIFGMSGAVYSSGPLPDSTTSVTIPANTLMPGMSYSWDLDFDDRITGFDINHSGIPTQQLFDVRTRANFMTLPSSVPEPATFIPLGLVLAGLFAARMRRRAGC